MTSKLEIYKKKMGSATWLDLVAEPDFFQMFQARNCGKCIEVALAASSLAGA